MKKFLLLFLLLPFLGFAQVMPAGDYIISSANTKNAYPDFKNITTAVSYLNSHGIGGNVRFLLDKEIYDVSTGEAFPIVINSYVGNALYTVTFKPNTNKTVVITATNNANTVSAVFKLNGADKIVFDGSNIENGTSKDLTLYNATTATNSSNRRAVIWIASMSNSDGSNDNRIENVIIQQHNKGYGDYSIGIFAGGTDLVTSEAQAANSNNIVSNVKFSKVGQAIYVNGSSNANLLSSNWYIKNNTIGDSTVSTNYAVQPYLGVNLKNVKDYEISYNIMSGITNDVNAGVESTPAAIWVDGQSNGVINNNTIANVFNSIGNSTPDSRGIYINSSNNLIYNNFISNVYSSVSYSKSYGVYINSGSANKIYYNTIVMNNNNNPSGSTCLYINSGTNIEIKNNIFYNSQTNASQYAIFANVDKTSLIINFNDYYSKTIGYLGGDRTTLANWKTATGQDAQSNNVVPSFVSTKDLHLQNVAANNGLQGVLIQGITKDIDGDDRVKPYMGADEIACTAPAVTIKVPTNIICQGDPTSLTFTATAVNSGTTPNYQWKVNGVNVGAVTSSPNFTSKSLSVGDVVTVIVYSNAICATGLSALSNGVRIESQTTIFTGSWTIPPAPNLSAEIRSDYSGSNLEVCSLLVTNKAAVNVKAGNYLKVYNDVKIDNGGTLTLESDGNLIQVNEGVDINTGTITAKRNLTLSAGRQQYNYLISPLEDYSLANIYKDEAGNAVKVPFVLYHNQANNQFYTSSGAYIKGRGLAVKEPEKTAFSSGTMVATFVGKPTNGAFSYTVVKSSEDNSRGYNLIGNPYPSTIDLEAFYKINSTTIDSTVYLWDNKANSQTSQMGDSYGGQAYATYNVLVKTGIRATGDPQLVGTKKSSQYIKSGQGFMVKSRLTSGTLNFNNTIRTKAPDSGDFFGKTEDQTETPVNRFWLNMISPANISSNNAVVYSAVGNSAFGQDDSRSMGGSDALYSIVEAEKVAINGRGSFTNTDSIPLGSQHFVNGNYTISIDAVEGIFADGQNIYLKDKQNGIITNLNLGSYTFSANAGESSGRFEIIYRPETVLATNDSTKNQIIVYCDGSDVIIRSPKVISNVNVYDLSGKLMRDLIPNNVLTKIDISMVPNGVYILRIKNKDGEIVNRKFIR